MDDPKLIAGATSLISEILKAIVSHGVEGIIGLWLIWDKWIFPRLKKNKDKGERLSWRDINAMKEAIVKLDFALSQHLEEEQKENVKFAVMDVRVANQEKETVEIKGDIKDVFRILSEIKNMMIEKGK